jgi:DNA repair photolyase
MESDFEGVVPPPSLPPIKGRGAETNPANRFEPIAVELDPESLDAWNDDAGTVRTGPPTQVFLDRTRSIIATNDSPDVGFEASVNPYRGCEHGCVYCYARPTHEYFGLSAGLDFETKLFVKRDAPELLRAAFMKPSWEPRTLALSGVTDPYQPVERTLGVTRGCLEVLAAFGNPVTVITKNRLVTRDADLLGRLAAMEAASVFVSITTLDEDLRRRMEPRTTAIGGRLEAIRILAGAGIPTGVIVGPVIPGLTDHELPAVLAAAAKAGATQAGYIVMRLPHGLAPLFTEWLGTHYPDRKEKVLNRIRSLRGGKLNDPRFGTRHTGEGVFAREIRALFDIGMRKAGLHRRTNDLSTAGFRRPGPEQMGLFGD